MRRAVVVMAFVVAAFGAVAVRVVLEGRHALADGDEAAAAGSVREAIARWEAAARWYLPGAPHVDGAYDRLRRTAEASDATPSVSLAAWRAIRSAAHATTSLWTPHAEDLSDADAHIAELSSRDPDGASAGGADAATRRAFHLDRLARPTRPSREVVALSCLGLITWLGAATYAVRRGFDRTGKLARGSAAVGAAVAAAGLAAWAISLYNV